MSAFGFDDEDPFAEGTGFAVAPGAAADGRPPRASIGTRDSGTGTSAFASPLSHLSSSTTGGESLSTSKEKLVKLLLIVESNQVCGGAIRRSSKTRFCTVDAVGGCSVESHKTKLKVLSNCVYIRHNRGSQAWITPCLPVGSVPAAQLESLLNEEDTVPRFKIRIADLSGRDRLIVDTASDTNSSFDLLDTPTSTVGNDTPSAEDIRRAEKDVATPVSLRSASVIPKTIIEESRHQLDDEAPNIWNDQVNQFQDLSDIPLSDGIPESFDDATMSVIADWGKLKDNLGLIRDKLESLKEGKEFLRVRVETGMRMVDSKMKTVDTKIQLLHQAIGSDPSASDDGSKSLWDVMAEIKEAQMFYELRVDGLAQMLINDQGTGLGDKVDVMEQTTAGLKSHITQLKAWTRKYLNVLNERIKVVESTNIGDDDDDFLMATGVGGPAKKPASQMTGQLATLEKQVHNMKGFLQDLHNIKNLDSIDTDIPKLKKDVEKIKQLLKGSAHKRVSKSKQAKARKHRKDSAQGEKDRASKWEGGFSSMGGILGRQDSNKPEAMDYQSDDGEFSSSNSSGSDSATSSVFNSRATASTASDDTLAQMGDQIRAELDQMKHKLAALETPDGAKGYDEGGYTFTTEHDLFEFMRKNNVDASFCYDWYSAIAAKDDKNEKAIELGKQFEVEAKTGISTMEFKLRLAMGLDLPSCFFAPKGRGAIQDRDEGFAACPTYAEWIGSSGRRVAFHAAMTSELESFLKGIEGNYRGRSGEPADFVRHLVGQIRVQWSAIQTFFNDSYIKLTGQAHFSSKGAWILIGRYGAAMFEAMNKHRHAAQMLSNPKTLNSKVTLVWAVLQSHRVLNDFIRIQFDAHPAIVKEMSFFTLMERVDPSDVRKLEAEVEKLQTEASSLKKEMAKAKELSNNANNTVVQLKKNQELLEKRLKTVEGKVS